MRRLGARIVHGKTPGTATAVPAVELVTGALQHATRHRLVQAQPLVQLQEVGHESRRMELQLMRYGLRYGAKVGTFQIV